MSKSTLIRVNIEVKKIIETYCFEEYKKNNPKDFNISMNKVLKSMASSYCEMFFKDEPK